MIDQPSRSAVQFLEALAGVNSRLSDLARQLRTQTDVTEVSHRLECKRYDTGAVLEGYVDVELRHGHALTWWLELRCDADRWVIETSVLVTHDAGQDTLVRFPQRCALTLDECLVQLDGATADLVASLKSVDLATPVVAN